MKSIALLATALFLASAPTPDSEAISELSAGFLFSDNAQALMAAEAGHTVTQQVQGSVSTSTTLATDKPAKASSQKTDINLLPAE